jgi:hypothetical protein
MSRQYDTVTHGEFSRKVTIKRSGGVAVDRFSADSVTWRLQATEKRQRWGTG